MGRTMYYGFIGLYYGCVGNSCLQHPTAVNLPGVMAMPERLHTCARTFAGRPYDSRHIFLHILYFFN